MRAFAHSLPKRERRPSTSVPISFACPFSILRDSYPWRHRRRDGAIAEETAPHDNSQDISPAKRTGGLRSASNFPPAFWDSLSKFWLTPRALRELDRRNSTRRPTKSTTPGRCSRYGSCSAGKAPWPRSPSSPRCKRVAPSLHDCRLILGQCPDVTALQAPWLPVICRQFPKADTESTKVTSISSKVRGSSAYDDDFEQHLWSSPEYHMTQRSLCPDKRPRNICERCYRLPK